MGEEGYFPRLPAIIYIPDCRMQLSKRELMMFSVWNDVNYQFCVKKGGH